ncbi:uncharacterized protein LOC125670712 [Ostrea edulis]|uniref:uncharacterized protein LOC125670712 n=1 Tax=Ostrea edulis TaxID=37623 RepID=UPI0024AF1A46|nr:uncharacterized protein LOC125670712 [Ostrea edulis]XP_048762013.2 uncharacterized protein LOC125670712 [Ostrea edulis]XP_056018409.1 uncharacterized protein LOC125670712 [Ostrea edulis]
MSKAATKSGYDRVPLVSGTHSDSDGESEPISYIEINKRYRNRNQRKPLLAAGVVVIIVLLTVILAMCYVLLTRSNTASAATTTPAVTGTMSKTPGPLEVMTTTKRAEESNRRQTPNWEVTFRNMGSECAMRLIDIDGDGLQDVVFGAATTADLAAISNIDVSGSLRAFCNATGRTYPCIGTFIGMRGYDGKVLWKIPTRSGTLLNNCEDFDLNLDGHIDCVVGGRSATMEAIDVRNGKHIWEATSPFFTKIWNFYQAMALPDFNGDGVKEILVMHGGNPNKDATDHNRESGRLIMLDGKTGKGMGLRCLEMPHSKESYQSPVVYTYRDGSQYILFGSGGETVPGDFMMISLPDFYRYVMGLPKDTAVPNTKGSYNQWSRIPRQADTGIMVIFTGVTKGVMVPPLMTDIDHDGVDDIVMSAYDGSVMLLDGKTMKTKWKVEFPGMESYSTPAPGYFDDDNVLDFMVHWSTGAWPTYNASEKVIISGKDGTILWRADMKNYEMSSDLTLQTTEPYRDLYLYKMKGRGAHVYKDLTGEIHGVGVQRNISIIPTRKSTMSPDENDEMVYKDFMKFHFQCNAGVDIKSEIFVMDRTTADTPMKVLESTPMEFNYHPSTSWKTGAKNKNLTYCAVLIPEDRTTSAVGDVDGDGSLDIVVLVSHTGQIVDQHYSYDAMVYHSTIHKINLQPIIQNPETRTSMKIHTTLPLDRYRQEKDVSLLHLLPLQKQQWLSYFGTKQNGHFKNKR